MKIGMYLRLIFSRRVTTSGFFPRREGISELRVPLRVVGTGVGKTTMRGTSLRAMSPADRRESSLSAFTGRIEKPFTMAWSPWRKEKRKEKIYNVWNRCWKL